MNIDLDRLKVISPYPWGVIEDNVIVDADGHHIAETDSGYYPPKDEDALVIAAAPELLASVIDLCDLIEKQLPIPTKRYVALNNDRAMRLAMAKAAIAKAIGNNSK